MTSIPKSQRVASTWFIFITIVIDAIGLGIVIPVLPDVIRRFIADEAAVSRMFGYFVGVYALMQFMSAPLLGSLSDRFGRRPVLLTSLLGAAVDYFFMAFAPTLSLLFLGRVISGVSGASFTVASAYMADISTSANRSKNFGLIGAGFGFGFIIGPAVGGLLAAWGPQYPFLAAGCFNLLNFIFGLFVLPESLDEKHRRKLSTRAINPLASLSQIIGIPAIRMLVIVHVLAQLANLTHPSIWTLYTQHRFGWSASQVGMSLAAVGVLSALSQGGLTGILVKRFGERKVLLYCCLGEAISFALFGYAYTGTMLYAVLIVSSLFWAMPPALQSLISNEVPANKQGELQGSLMSLTSLMSIANPILMTSIFSMASIPRSKLYMPGAPYYLASALLFVAWLLISIWERRHSRSS